MKKLILSCVAALPLLLIGCGPENEVVKLKGKITFTDGKPLPEGTRIAFRPQDNSYKSSLGKTNADGSFEMEHESGTTGVEVGKYRVAVLPPEGQEAAFQKIVPTDYIDGSMIGIEVKPGMADLDLKVKPIKRR